MALSGISGLIELFALPAAVLRLYQAAAFRSTANVICTLAGTCTLALWIGIYVLSLY